MLPPRIVATLRSPLLGALIFLSALALFLTWPQGLHLGTKVAGHPDPLLSIWRLEWVAHALPGDFRHLFDGNIFSPHLRTLAYSDATLFQFGLAAPWLWADTNPVLVYNLLLLAGIVSSGLGMFVLVRHLTGNADAALVSAAIFTLVPYRIEHVMHLELQWTVWMPLTMWAVHRVFESGSIRLGVVAGALLCLQVLSSMYYGAFLGIMIAVLSVLLALVQPRQAVRALAPLAIAAIMAAAATAVYAQPYMENARSLGMRDLGDVSRFSAHLASYVTAPPTNWLWGWTASRFDGNELRLFPGLVTIVLSVLALAQPRRRIVWVYLAMAAIAAALSLGLNGPVYRWLYEHVWVFGGFRAPARFSILACCALAVSGRDRVRIPPADCFCGAHPAGSVGRGAGGSRARVRFMAMYLVELPPRAPVPDVYKFLSARDRAVIMELPTFLSPTTCTGRPRTGRRWSTATVVTSHRTTPRR